MAVREPTVNEKIKKGDIELALKLIYVNKEDHRAPNKSKSKVIIIAMGVYAKPRSALVKVIWVYLMVNKVFENCVAESWFNGTVPVSTVVDSNFIEKLERTKAASEHLQQPVKKTVMVDVNQGWEIGSDKKIEVDEKKDDPDHEKVFDQKDVADQTTSI